MCKCDVRMHARVAAHASHASHSFNDAIPSITSLAQGLSVDAIVSTKAVEGQGWKRQSRSYRGGSCPDWKQRSFCSSPTTPTVSRPQPWQDVTRAYGRFPPRRAWDCAHSEPDAVCRGAVAAPLTRGVRKPAIEGTVRVRQVSPTGWNRSPTSPHSHAPPMGGLEFVAGRARDPIVVEAGLIKAQAHGF
jgi:hypothetical protein